MEHFQLNGKVALVTGGNSGIGLAYAKGMVKAGAKVAIWGRNEEKNANAVQALKDLGGDAAAFVCDVVHKEQINKTFDATIARFGQVDICFANAGGIGPQGMMHQVSDEDWQHIMDLNLNSVIWTYKRVIDQLLTRKAPGKLIVTSSIAGVTGSIMSSGYGTTKTAILGLTRSLSMELARAGIQVNAILPGYIATELTAHAPKIFTDAMHRRAASGKIGTLEQMEGIAIFLASKASDYMTGQSIVMDGGHTIHPL